MSDATPRQRETRDVSRPENRPAVGVIATAENGDAVAGTLLRARRHGYDQLVYAAVPDGEAVRVAEQLSARIIEPDEPLHDATARWQHLAAVARDAGYPGLIKHADVSLAVDFEATEEMVRTGGSYLVEPAYQSRLDATPEILVAIPAYNEAETIGDVVEAAQGEADTVLVIDDGSTDDTVARARQAGATVIEHETNKGYGGALKTAFAEAERVGADHLAIVDGDGQHDPTDIGALIEHQRDTGTAIVIGSRFDGGSVTDLPLYRQVGLRVVNLLTNLSLGVVRSQSRIRDTQSGFRVYNRDAIQSLATDDGIGDGMGASTDILYHAHRNGHSVAEVGTTVDYDVEDTSSQHPVSHGLQLVRNILRTVEREHPVLVLGVPGAVSTAVGLGFGYATFANYLSTSTFPLGLAIVSVFFVLAGIFAAFTGIILHSLEAHAE